MYLYEDCTLLTPSKCRTDTLFPDPFHVIPVPCDIPYAATTSPRVCLASYLAEGVVLVIYLRLMRLTKLGKIYNFLHL